MTHTRSAGGVILNSKGQVAVVNQHGTSWSLPKGTVEQGEDDMTTAKREIQEETGLTNLHFVKELGSYDRSRLNHDGTSDAVATKTITMFLFTTSEENLKPIDPENPSAHWADKHEVSALLTHPKDKAFFESILHLL